MFDIILCLCLLSPKDSTLVIKPDLPPERLVIRGSQVPYLHVRTYPGFHLKFELTNSSIILPPFTIVPGFVADEQAFFFPIYFGQMSITHGGSQNFSSYELGSQFAVIHPIDDIYFEDHDSFAVVEISAIFTGGKSCVSL